MESSAVLVLGSERSSQLSRKLVELGLRPVTQFTMREALDRLRHGRFAAVLVDREFVAVDALEFVLNVRDVDSHTPIVVVGSSTVASEDRLLRSQIRTCLIDGDPTGIERALREAPDWVSGSLVRT